MAIAQELYDLDCLSSANEKLKKAMIQQRKREKTHVIIKLSNTFRVSIPKKKATKAYIEALKEIEEVKGGERELYERPFENISEATFEEWHDYMKKHGGVLQVMENIAYTVRTKYHLKEELYKDKLAIFRAYRDNWQIGEIRSHWRKMYKKYIDNYNKRKHIKI